MSKTPYGAIPPSKTQQRQKRSYWVWDNGEHLIDTNYDTLMSDGKGLCLEAGNPSPLGPHTVYVFKNYFHAYAYYCKCLSEGLDPCRRLNGPQKRPYPGS